MPDEEKKMVDIDTSGPEVDVELETQQEESEVSVPEEKETVTEVTSPEPLEASDEKQETKTEEPKEDQKDELEVYSKDVQRRIAKLTKKWREAERQKEEAIQFARIQTEKANKLDKKYSSLETNSLKTKETQIASALQGAKARLAQARESGDIESEVEIQKDISRLGYEEARLLELKAAKEEHQKEEIIPTMNNFVAPEAPQSTADPKAEDWASKNRWFGTDKAMTYTAFDLHNS